jgi:hypothetical protein
MTKWGNIPKLTHCNYDEWRDDMIPVLSAISADEIVSGHDPQPQHLDLDHNDNCEIGRLRKWRLHQQLDCPVPPKYSVLLCYRYKISSEGVEHTSNQPGHRRILYRQTEHSAPVPCLSTQGGWSK